MSWTVSSTERFDEWFESLIAKKQRSIVAAVGLLREDGPTLGRPVVDSIKGSRHSNMKELRAGTLRVLFAFDPDRTAVLLLGGDKRDRWQQWYREAIPEADDLLEKHLQRSR